MSIHTNILLGIAVILIVYIIGNLFFDWFQNDHPKNIGCYLDQSVRSAQELQSRLLALKFSEESKNYITYKTKSIVESYSSFHNKSVGSAVAFERYILRMAEDQDKQRQNMEVLLALKEAEKEYMFCKEQIKISFKSKDCVQNWNSYSSCSNEVDELKKKMEDLKLEKRHIELKIDENIQKPNSSPYPNDLLEEEYKDRMAKNEKAKSELQQQLELLQVKFKNSSISLSQSTEKKIELQKYYYECTNNRQEFKNCEQIRSQVSNLDSGSLKILKERIQYKQKMLSQLQNLITISTDEESTKHLREQNEHHSLELRNMLKNYADANKQIEKACGCSETDERSRLTNFEEAKLQEDRMKQEVKKIRTSIVEIENKLEQNERERERIGKDYEEYKKKRPGNTPISKTAILQLKEQLGAINKQLLLLEGKYQSLLDRCTQYTDSMKLRIKEVDKVVSCLKKKEFFLELRKQFEKYLRPEAESEQVLRSKRDLVQRLEEFGQL